jgi:uncharacterized protein (TIGR03118 family)
VLITLILVASPAVNAAGQFYTQRNLVSDGSISADHTDTNLVNVWGLAFNPNGVVWVANNHTGTSTLYDGLGSPNALVVTIPVAPGSTGPGSPTGIVFSGSGDFTVTNGTVTGPSRFIFATEDGVIAGWSPSVNATQAIQALARPNTVYKGLALAANGSGNFLYATDFRGGKIDVFDKTFQPVTMAGNFTDPRIPKGYAPFGIQNIGGALYVTYAKQDATKTDDVARVGYGFLSIFDANGVLIRHFASRGKLNAPWGLALAPADFGTFSNRLLVGNFGDGAILAFDIHSGSYVGQLRKSSRQNLKIAGLWGLQFGNGILNQPTRTLFFAAGPGDEEHGLYGRIEPAGTTSTKNPYAEIK